MTIYQIIIPRKVKDTWIEKKRNKRNRYVGPALLLPSISDVLIPLYK